MAKKNDTVISDEIKHRFLEFSEILVAIILDTLIVIVITLITYFVKWFIEFWYHQPIEKIDNLALATIYKISKIILIILVATYAIFDIAILIFKKYKFFRNEINK